jgi:hypothetical protein
MISRTSFPECHITGTAARTSLLGFFSISGAKIECDDFASARRRRHGDDSRTTRDVEDGTHVSRAKGLDDKLRLLLVRDRRGRRETIGLTGEFVLHPREMVHGYSTGRRVRACDSRQ